MLKRPGFCVLGCFVRYGLTNRGQAARALLRSLFDWIKEITAWMPRRCAVLHFADANARVGTVAAHIDGSMSPTTQVVTVDASMATHTHTLVSMATHEVESAQT